MKISENLIDQIKALPSIDKNAICQLGKQLGLKSSSVDTYISRFLKGKEIFQLKNGLYVSTDFFNKNKNDISYSFYLANILRVPSYVSSWAALQYYNLTTESIGPVTSVTIKATRNYLTKAGDFNYHSIKKELFSDFYLEKGKFDFYIAWPSKALFDLLYYKTNQFRSISLKAINLLIEELRVDFDEIDKKEQDKFRKLIKDNLYE